MIIKAITVNNILTQCPGLVSITDTNSRVIEMNAIGLKWIGCAKQDILGRSYEDAKCKASEHADYFKSLDKHVMRTDDPLYFTGYYSYHKNDWKIIFGKKYSLYDSKKTLMGVVTTFDEITEFKLIDLYRFLTKDKNKINLQQFCYTLPPPSLDKKFTDRELECLFFLLRGKSASEIGHFLHLSKRTIEDYLVSLRIKLNCTSKSDLIEKSLSLGLLSILPKSLVK